ALGEEAVLDQVFDRQDPEPVLLREALEVRHPRHRPVLVHDLADDAGGREVGEAREIDGPLSLAGANENRSEEHTSELQSLTNLVCRLLLEKKKKYENTYTHGPSFHVDSPAS